MRNLVTIGSFGLLVAACDSGIGTLPAPPALKVTSPVRSLMQGQTGTVLVTGTVAPGEDGAVVDKVTVNDVTATLGTDGAFTAAITIPQGATFIHTEAISHKGGKATDTRSIEAGALRAPGSNIDSAITMAISKNGFAKLSQLAGTLISQMDFTQMLAAKQPMMSKGGSCLGAKLYLDSMTLTDAHISLTPVDGGLMFAVEVDGLNAHGHANYDVACIDGSDTFHVTATKVNVAGTLDVTPNGNMGFKTKLVSPNVSMTNLNVDASGLPGAILDIVDFNAWAGDVVSVGAELFMDPMMNKALGGLTGPQQLMVAGKTIDYQIAPSNIQFTAAEADIALDTKLLIEGAEGSKGYVYTDNGVPTMSPGMGLQLGLADDLANEMMSQFAAIGMINVTQPATGGTFDSMNLQPTSPPMISADPADGHLVVVLPDMTAMFQLQGQPVAKAALNVALSIQITTTADGRGASIKLGEPVIYLDVLDDIPNNTHQTPEDLQKSMQLCLSSQIDSLSTLLSAVPLPHEFGLALTDLTVGGDNGYVMVNATLQ
jgi:hypothetical protein